MFNTNETAESIKLSMFSIKYKKSMILFLLCFFLAKRYLLTDNIVKLKEFQHKKVAIGHNLPGTKGSIINSFLDISSIFIRLQFLLLDLMSKKKNETI